MKKKVPLHFVNYIQICLWRNFEGMRETHRIIRYSIEPALLYN